MKKSSLLLKSVLAFCMSFVVLITVDCFIPRDESKIYDSVIRLHILANSDSEVDQQLKLKVRDAIIAQGEELFEGCEEGVLPFEKMQYLGEKFASVANRVIKENGFTYSANAVWGTERYPTREYDGISFPSGEYYSLRINLGRAEGENWWCVLFPPLCTSASGANRKFSEMGVSDSGKKVYTKKRYVFRFKLLELFNR
ncbi:MAG: stage II sporulation protein R [Eubacteriales bacterium]|nr:stage II sporulation protein R [Eubacteriales bacterium]